MVKNTPQHRESARQPRRARLAQVLERSRLADPGQHAHEQPQILCCGVNQQPLADLLMASQMRASHAAGLVVVREWPLHQFAAEST